MRKRDLSRRTAKVLKELMGLTLTKELREEAGTLLKHHEEGARPTTPMKPPDNPLASPRGKIWNCIRKKTGGFTVQNLLEGSSLTEKSFYATYQPWGSWLTKLGFIRQCTKKGDTLLILTIDGDTGPVAPQIIRDKEKGTGLAVFLQGAKKPIKVFPPNSIKSARANRKK